MLSIIGIRKNRGISNDVAAVFAVYGETAVKPGEGAPSKKNECMFEKMLGKLIKTRYYKFINN